MKRTLGLIFALLPTIVSAQSNDTESADESSDIVKMPTLHVTEAIAANDTPSAGFATPVTYLRFQPSVDVQSRGIAETQCDVVIRGGIFENTGFKIGAINLMDPQTGHYGSELPIDPMMLSNPKVLTGVDNAANGFNSSVGTVFYNWLPLNTSGTIEVGAGSDSLSFARLVSGYKSADNVFLGRSVGVQVTSAYSEGNGTIENTDHHFQRYGIRVQLSNTDGQTDIYAGYQRKFYGWPGMYTTKAAYPESDKYEVALLMINHTQKYGNDSHWSAGAYTRQVLDDYELKRTVPGYYRPYLHKSLISGIAAEGEHNISDAWVLDWRAEAASDSIESTELTYGDFMSRSYWKGSALLGHQIPAGNGDFLIQAGMNYEDSNRDSSGTGPLARITYNVPALRGFLSLYTEYSRATQVSGYTAIGSNPGPGSFAGNADLERERADNYEAGAQWSRGNFVIGTSIFYREHVDLADWTYDSTQPSTLRQASAMDLNVLGFETYATWRPSKMFSVTAGYTHLEEDEDYDDATVDASFYAMNFPRHRVSGSVIWKPFECLEFRIDADIRKQERNALRQNGNDAVFVNASIGWTPGWVDGMTVSVIADNLTDDDFQEFPGVPANGRQAALRISYIW